MPKNAPVEKHCNTIDQNTEYFDLLDIHRMSWTTQTKTDMHTGKVKDPTQFSCYIIELDITDAFWQPKHLLESKEILTSG